MSRPRRAYAPQPIPAHEGPPFHGSVLREWHGTDHLRCRRCPPDACTARVCEDGIARCLSEVPPIQLAIYNPAGLVPKGGAR